MQLCCVSAGPSGDCDVTKGCSPSYQEWGRAGRAPAPGGGGCLELSLSWVDTTGRPFAQHKAAPDRWWQLREKQKGEQTLWLHPLSQCCWPVCHWYTGRSSTSAYRQHNGYSLQLECTVLISWLHIISSAWLTHFLFAPSTSLTQHSDHTMNLLMLRSQSTYELSSQFVGIKDGNVMIQHLQRWPWGCIRGSRACSESTAWCWTASPWHTAAREDTCHQTTGTAYWTRNNVCIWKSKCTQIITSYIIMQLHMV